VLTTSPVAADVIVRVPVRPARLGNWLRKVILMVGTSRTHTVPAAPKVNVSGSVEVLVVDDDDVVVVPGWVVVVGATVVEVVVVGVVVDVLLVDVVVSSGGQSSGSVTTAVAVSPSRL
jgi:hypothetical protein